MVWYFIGVYNNKQNITWLLGDAEFLFSCWKNISLIRRSYEISSAAELQQ